MLGKMNSCKNNPEQCFATSIEKHTPCEFSVFIKYPFVESKNNFFYRGPDSMSSKFCEIRKDNYSEDINFEQKNIEKVELIEKSYNLTILKKFPTEVMKNLTIMIEILEKWEVIVILLESILV